MSVARLVSGQNVRVRGMRAVITGITASAVDADAASVTVRVVDGERKDETFSVFTPIDAVESEEVPELQIERRASYAVWQRFHDAFRLELALPPESLVANPQAQISIDDYQLIPAKRLLSLPRPRLLIADDVGLGKTVEAGIAYLELAQRRMARRVLIVTPASLRTQWRDELLQKFGIQFDIFDRAKVDEIRLNAEIGANPWLLRPRVIVSIDTAKVDSTFAELRRTAWDLVIIDEAHHVADRSGERESRTQNRRFAEWIAQATRGLILLSATPHDGDDASFASLLRLLEPRIAISGAALDSGRTREYVVRRLKRDVHNSDGTAKFAAREAVVPLAVELSPRERDLTDAVLGAIRTTKEHAKRAGGEVRSRTEFLTTILRKRLASSRAALAKTLQSRQETLDDDLADLQTRRDLLRRARAEEPLTDSEQEQLERELHAASFVSARNALAKAQKLKYVESEEFERVQHLCAEIQNEPESKLAVLVAYLDRIWRGEPNENVLLFTEYRDTAEALAGEGAPLRLRYGDRVVVLHGEVSDRDERLKRFQSGTGMLLVATDVASEGLNLQERSRTVVHYDLPWNPNRLEQRNGRVDRYGQTRAPRIAFLYAKETYDGEILKLLVQKIDRQIKSLGSVGDVLGALQQRKIDALFEDPKIELTTEDERSINIRVAEVVEAAAAPRALEDINVQERPPLTRPQPDLGTFVAKTIEYFGGRASVRDRILAIVRPPDGWSAFSEYALPGSKADAPFLALHSSIARQAINATRELRYDKNRDPRAAARIHPSVAEPTLVATYLASVRSRDGYVEERLLIIATTQSAPYTNAEQLLDDVMHPEPPDFKDRVAAAFSSWWKPAHAELTRSAEAQALAWSKEIAERRTVGIRTHKQAVNDWYGAERQAAQAGGSGELLPLAGIVESSSIRRVLEQIDAERERQLRELAMHAEIDPPTCDPIGVLLVLPVNT